MFLHHTRTIREHSYAHITVEIFGYLNTIHQILGVPYLSKTSNFKMCYRIMIQYMCAVCQHRMGYEKHECPCYNSKQTQSQRPFSCGRNNGHTIWNKDEICENCSEPPPPPPDPLGIHYPYGYQRGYYWVYRLVPKISSYSKGIYCSLWVSAYVCAMWW